MQHFVVELSEIRPADYRFGFTVIAVKTEAGNNVEVASTERVNTRARQITTHFELPRDWPTGSYELRISMDGERLRSESYRVE